MAAVGHPPSLMAGVASPVALHRGCWDARSLQEHAVCERRRSSHDHCPCRHVSRSGHKAPSKQREDRRSVCGALSNRQARGGPGWLEAGLALSRAKGPAPVAGPHGSRSQQAGLAQNLQGPG